MRKRYIPVAHEFSNAHKTYVAIGNARFSCKLHQAFAEIQTAVRKYLMRTEYYYI